MALPILPLASFGTAARSAVLEALAVRPAPGRARGNPAPWVRSRDTPSYHWVRFVSGARGDWVHSEACPSCHWVRFVPGRPTLGVDFSEATRRSREFSSAPNPHPG